MEAKVVQINEGHQTAGISAFVSKFSVCVHKKQKREDQYARLRSINNGGIQWKSVGMFICRRPYHIVNVTEQCGGFRGPVKPYNR